MREDAITGLVFMIVCAGIVPIFYMWQSARRRMNETETRKQIVLAAIEKNKETDVEDLLKKMAPKQKLLKEKLLAKLLWGCIFSLIGFIIFGCGLWIDWCGGSDPDEIHFLYFCGGVLFAIGIGFLIYYFVGKKMLAKELEAEEKKLMAEANL